MTAESIGYSYRKTGPVLSDVTFSAGPGVTGLLGVNGAGKTTLMKVLASIYRPSSGQLHWDGGSFGTAERRRIGFMPQQQNVARGFTVREYVEYVAWLRGVPRRSCHDQTSQALATVSLAERAAVP